MCIRDRPKDFTKWIEFPNALRNNESNAYIPKNGMELWLDAKNINGGENLNLNNGASISIWKDLSGKANHLSQEITQKRPIFSLYGLNNYPEVKFHGIKSSEGDYLEKSNGFEITTLG